MCVSVCVCVMKEHFQKLNRIVQNDFAQYEDDRKVCVNMWTRGVVCVCTRGIYACLCLCVHTWCVHVCEDDRKVCV